MKPFICALILMCALSGCTFSREMIVNAKIDDAKYGIAEGTGRAVYESETTFSVFCKNPTEEK